MANKSNVPKKTNKKNSTGKQQPQEGATGQRAFVDVDVTMTGQLWFPPKPHYSCPI